MYITLSLTNDKGNTVISKMGNELPIVEHYLNPAINEEKEELVMKYFEDIVDLVKEEK